MQDQQGACIFCKIVSGQLPAYKVYEDEYVLAFLDIQPVGVGHTLVVPKQHYQNVHDMPEQMSSYIYAIVKRIADAQRKVFNPAGISVAQNNGAAAGQVIFHFHAHVIPKTGGPQQRLQLSESDLTFIAQKIREGLGV